MNRFSIRALDEIVDAIADIHTTTQEQTQSRAISLSALATVTGHDHVRTWLVQRPANAQRDFARGLLDLGLRSCAPSDNKIISDNLAFDVLATIADLSRRQHSQDAQSKQTAERVKKMQAAFITVICSVQLPPQAQNLDIWGLLQIMKMQFVHDEIIVGMAEDLLDALPTKVTGDETADQRKKADEGNSSSNNTKMKESSSVDQQQQTKFPTAATILSTWTKERKEKSKDLLFLDVTRQAELGKSVPLVCRALKTVCANCNKQSSEPGKYFSGCGFCRAVFYCSGECQKAHWTSTHKLACLPLKKEVQEIPDTKEGNKKIHEGTFLKVKPEIRDAFCSLFFENRAFSYTQRKDTLKAVQFADYFMDYAESA